MRLSYLQRAVSRVGERSNEHRVTGGRKIGQPLWPDAVVLDGDLRNNHRTRLPILPTGNTHMRLHYYAHHRDWHSKIPILSRGFVKNTYSNPRPFYKSQC